MRRFGKHFYLFANVLDFLNFYRFSKKKKIGHTKYFPMCLLFPLVSFYHVPFFTDLKNFRGKFFDAFRNLVNVCQNYLANLRPKIQSNEIFRKISTLQFLIEIFMAFEVSMAFKILWPSNLITSFNQINSCENLFAQTATKMILNVLLLKTASFLTL